MKRFAAVVVGLGIFVGCSSEGGGQSGAIDSDSDELRRKGSCIYDGVRHGDGTSFPSSDGCNTCSCQKGSVFCTKRACIDLDASTADAEPTADAGDAGVAEADASAGLDAAAEQDASDAAAAVDSAKPPGSCVYNNTVYAEGASFPSSDGCNSCSCWSGRAICTKRACRFDASVP